MNVTYLDSASEHALSLQNSYSELNCSYYFRHTYISTASIQIKISCEGNFSLTLHTGCDILISSPFNL